MISNALGQGRLVRGILGARIRNFEWLRRLIADCKIQGLFETRNFRSLHNAGLIGTWNVSRLYRAGLFITWNLREMYRAGSLGTWNDSNLCSAGSFAEASRELERNELELMDVQKVR